ncbi:MAG TPA: ATP-dependent DNA helicase [Acidimicrobiales bacterium]|nr:ATP-dependent DNA helicase [Acidimicrobiales bacterium]
MLDDATILDEAADDAARAEALTRQSLDLLRRIVAAKGGGGEERPQQQRMVAAIAAALAVDGQVAVQAGCGVGKSLAYLSAVVASGMSSCVVTTTKALQDQLFAKDLPTVAAAAGRPVKYVVIKGKSNYVCPDRLAELDGDNPSAPAHQGALDLGDAAAPAPPGTDVDEVTRLRQWAATTLTGDRAELDFEPSPQAWSAVSTTSEACPGVDKCPSGDRCFAAKAKQEAEDADVMVVNAHLYGAHLACGGNLLPIHDVLVMDEAHDVENAITGAFSVELSEGRVNGIASLVAGAVSGSSAAANLRAVGKRLGDALAPLSGVRLAMGTSDPRLAEVAADLAIAAENASRDVRVVKERVKGTKKAHTLGRAERALKALDGLRMDLDAAAEGLDGAVCWVEGAGHDRHVLKVAPVEIGGLLASTLWPTLRAAVLASATMPEAVPRRLGMHDAPRVDVGSPFPFHELGLLYVPGGFPDPNSPKHAARVVDEIVALIEAAGGRTMALFTSWKNLHAAADAVRARVGDRYPILVQGDAPKQLLVDQFASDPAACLFATASFRQGVDVPGETCAVVVMDRVPFPRPDDPLIQARRDAAGQSAFQTVDLPWSAAQLAQGAGRLIRTATDRGVVAVLDPRLAEARYRQKLLDALPPMRRTRVRADAVEFLRARPIQVGA